MANTKEYNKAYYEANKEYYREYAKRWRESNREAHRDINRRFAKNNPERRKELGRIHYDKHSDKIKDRVAKYKRDNPHKVNANAALRRASKINATPNWLTIDQKEEIKLYYEYAMEFTKSTGEQFHVDHIIPLSGKDKRGLHVPWNLAILTARDNLTKGNR